MIRGQSGQVIGAQMLTIATGAPFVGTVTVYVTVDNGAQALGSVGAGVCTAKGNGYYTYTPSAGETDGNLLAFTFVGTGALTRTVEVATVIPAQQSALQATTGVGSVGIRTIIRDAYAELGVYGAVDEVSPEDQDFALGKLNRIADNWNADRQGTYATTLVSFPLVPSLNPHTVGPALATYAVTQRPVAIVAARIVFGTDMGAPLELISRTDYMRIGVRNAISSLPGKLWYDPAWPNGNLYLWPIPTTAYPIELMVDTMLGQWSINDTFWLPPGYRDAFTLTLAEELSPSQGPEYQVSPRTTLSAQKARARIFGNNIEIPRLETCDSGMPGGGGGWFDWRTGSSRSSV